jgi:hypothetical protein
MGQRVKVIFREFRKSESEHLGKTGDMTELDEAVGLAEVRFDGGETVAIDACCLQHQDSAE